MILGQLYAGDNQAEKARLAFEKTQAIGPKTARVEAFLAGDDLLKGRYVKARATYESVEKSLPRGSVPFAIRFGVTFSHLYEGNVDAALDSLRTFLAEYKAGGLDQQFPEVFIWNATARINLENGRLEEAMKDYEKQADSNNRSTRSCWPAPSRRPARRRRRRRPTRRWSTRSGRGSSPPLAYPEAKRKVQAL